MVLIILIIKYKHLKNLKFLKKITGLKKPINNNTIKYKNLSTLYIPFKKKILKRLQK
jgi:hypothetical protein